MKLNAERKHEQNPNAKKLGIEFYAWNQKGQIGLEFDDLKKATFSGSEQTSDHILPYQWYTTHNATSDLYYELLAHCAQNHENRTAGAW